jgi:hypothetical protein
MVFEPTQMVKAKQGTYVLCTIGGIRSLTIPDGADGQGQWIVPGGDETKRTRLGKMETEKTGWR